MGRKRDSRSKENFARIPISVLESEAVTTLNHAAFRVLVILASQWKGGNNGTLALTAKYAERYGLSGRDTLYKALRELERRGLIVRTRAGIKSKRLFSLFAIGWESITHRDGQPLDTPAPKNNSAWLKWRDPSPTKKRTHKRKKTAEIQTDDRYTTVPTIGTDDPVCVPILADRLPVSVPTIGNTSRVWPAERSDAAPAPLSDPLLSPIPSARSRGRTLSVRIGLARRHLSADPRADNSQLARMYELTAEQVQQLKASNTNT